MAIFNRKGKNANRSDDGGSSAGAEKKPFTARKPANTAFKQQRLKAWQPILTPKTVLPTFFLIGLIFAPIGAVLYYYASQVSEFTLDYTQCYQQTDTIAEMPSDKYSFNIVGNTDPFPFSAPSWHTVANSTAPTGRACEIFFTLTSTLQPTVLLYYKMTNYYQNHRRYVKSIDMNQLLGKNVSASDLQGGNCKPLGRDGDLGIYPCGLIANSMFNDTIYPPVLLNAPTTNSLGKRQDTGATRQYPMSEKNIIWPGEKKKYQKTSQNPNELIPPPYWRGSFPAGAYAPYSFPNGYSERIYDPSDDEHFMVWMTIAGLPTFRKLYMRNDNDPLQSGRYSITIFDNYPVDMFHGTKSIVISTVTWVGGRSVFLGAAFIATAALCVLLGLIFTARHLIRPRKLGDLSLLSWNE